ncbi:ubiquinol-cytochrome c reductase iron-sulfur subunit [Helicobacter muridarum]|uniref:Ubiquinol-cytochrome C reductase iron-sulfur subunit n=1 Tax=Helicobacter muridarum TaxID=216 RepID=A0A099TYZ4_9HELI|nr:ubiquinol-cytochrome c reductase iron-sulfur subunit [Helicobacter muridarum]TLE01143.1 ubiquinol-cytochrome c reductase iron-sulfur subunit [Helicobacter muridarum]STQ86013.1 ubiquinol-cytochrome C reductase iron-sulfur subunit [Helicobacter muridarum]
MADVKRRDFLGMTLGGVAGIGAIAALVAMKKTWDPLPSVVSAGFTTVDVNGMQEGEIRDTQWRGKPVYIMKKKSGDSISPDRDFKLGDSHYSIGIKICTHLGCIPNWKTNEELFHCPCHGGQFTGDGVNVAGTPPPRPFDIPPFIIKGDTTLVLGESGIEYEAMVKASSKA